MQRTSGWPEVGEVVPCLPLDSVSQSVSQSVHFTRSLMARVYIGSFSHHHHIISFRISSHRIVQPFSFTHIHTAFSPRLVSQSRLVLCSDFGSLTIRRVQSMCVFQDSDEDTVQEGSWQLRVYKFYRRTIGGPKCEQGEESGEELDVKEEVYRQFH